jgi:hypothetical protein
MPEMIQTLTLMTPAASWRKVTLQAMHHLVVGEGTIVIAKELLVWSSKVRMVNHVRAGQKSSLTIGSALLQHSMDLIALITLIRYREAE